eukprot:1339032-Pleurochrysis_carterae.AAC.1
MTPEYEAPAFDYFNGLCYIPPRKASMSIGMTNIRFAHLTRPTLERMGRILWSAGIRLPLPVLASIRASLHLARGMTENVLRCVFSIRQVHAGKSTPSTAHLVITPRMDYMLLSTPAADRLI